MKKAAIITVAGMIGSVGLCRSAAVPVPKVTAEQVREVLPQKLQHPYLHFTKSDISALLKRIKNDPGCAKAYEAVKGKADHAMRRSRRADVTALAFVYQMTGEKRYAQRAYDLVSAGGVPAVPRHFDLNVSRKCRSFALLYDWLYPALNAEQRDFLRQSLENLLGSLRGRHEKTWWVTACRCNWNPVCNSAAGVAALALLADDPSLVDVLAESYNGIHGAYNELGRDGDWCEGVGYWSYGLFVSLFYADALERLTEGKLDLLTHEKIVSNPVTFGLHTLVPPMAGTNGHWKWVNFEDSGDHREDSSFGYSKIAAATGSGEALWMRHTLFGEEGSGSPFDILWSEPGLKSALPEQASKHFRDYGWVVMRSGFSDPDKVMLAAVCAEHRDPTRELYIVRHEGADPVPVSQKPLGIELDTYFLSHGHLHAGTFNLYWRGEAYVGEMGKVAYPKDFWSPNRWSYPFANSTGHNVVFVDGEPQTSGKNVGGRVVEFRPGDDLDYTLLDASRAYPGEKLKTWRRHLLLDKPDTTVVLDEIDAPEGSRIDVRFHSECVTELHDGLLLLKGKSGLMALISWLQAPWEFKQDTHDLSGIKPFREIGNEKTFTDIGWTAQQECNVAATLILPVENLAQAQAIRDSLRFSSEPDGGAVLEFKRNGVVSSYRFLCGGNGLVLEAGSIR